MHFQLSLVNICFNSRTLNSDKIIRHTIHRNDIGDKNRRITAEREIEKGEKCILQFLKDT